MSTQGKMISFDIDLVQSSKKNLKMKHMKSIGDLNRRMNLKNIGKKERMQLGKEKKYKCLWINMD
jgi:hypothetical protein